MKKFLPFLIVILLASSCKKETVELLTYEATSHTDLPLADVLFVNDSVGYACGGDKWAKGIVLRSTDGGHSWSQPDSVFGQIAQCLFFFSAEEGCVGGGNSYLAHTTDSAKTFVIVQSDYRRINDMAFAEDHLHVVRVGTGEGYSDGNINYSADGGNNWTRTDLATSMAAVQYAGNGQFFASGFGVIYRSTDYGAHFTPLDIRGDFFLGLSFPSESTGYAAGYERLILKTTDGGNSWQKIMKGNAPFSAREHFRSIKFWDENNGFVCGDDGVMYQTTNGGDSWKKVKQFTEVNLQAIHLFSATAGVVVGDGGKIFLFKAP